MENERIREAARQSGVHLLEVARFAGYAPRTLYGKLSKQLNEDDERFWLKHIEELSTIDPEERKYHLYGMG